MSIKYIEGFADIVQHFVNAKLDFDAGYVYQDVNRVIQPLIEISWFKTRTITRKHMLRPLYWSSTSILKRAMLAMMHALACLIADIVQHFVDAKLYFEADYVYQDVNRAIQHVHRSGLDDYPLYKAYASATILEFYQYIGKGYVGDDTCPHIKELIAQKRSWPLLKTSYSDLYEWLLLEDT
ncbi:hypothetical protein LguiA_011061 [Lonicera macranthoides]